MAIRWNLEDIKGYKELCFYEDKDPIQGGTMMCAVTESLIYATMFIGINEITKKNYLQFFARIKIYEKVQGALRSKGMKDIYYTLEEIEQHIGLGTNASTLTNRGFSLKIYNTVLVDLERKERDKERKEVA